MRSQHVRIFHGPVDVGAQAWGLARGLDAHGFTNDVVAFDQTYFQYPADRNLRLGTRPIWQRGWQRARLLMEALRRYDVFIFYFAQSLLPYGADLPILKAAGKKIFFVFQGCDLRLAKMDFPTPNGRYISDHGAVCAVCRNIPDSLKRLRLSWIRRFADHLFVLNPDLLFVAPDATFLPYGHIDPNTFASLASRPPKRTFSAKSPLRILHAPTNREVKGTAAVVQAVKRLIRKGAPIQLDLVEGQPHSALLIRLVKADLVIDQLRIGWYGNVSVEAMAAGRPVICYLDPILLPMSGLKDCPILSATEITITKTIRQLLDQPDMLRTQGQAGLRFVRRYHTQAAAARVLLPYLNRSEQ